MLQNLLNGQVLQCLSELKNQEILENNQKNMELKPRAQSNKKKE